MKLRALLVIAVLLLFILFVATHWDLFSAPNQLNPLVLTVQVPIGIIMLAVAAGLSLFYGLLHWKVKTAALLASHESVKELEQARKAAMCAEDSRVHHLQEQLESQFEDIDDKLSQILTQVRPTVSRSAVRQARFCACLDRLGTFVLASTSRVAMQCASSAARSHQDSLAHPFCAHDNYHAR